jgi:hypothetical protein
MKDTANVGQGLIPGRPAGAAGDYRRDLHDVGQGLIPGHPAFEAARPVGKLL